MANVSSSNGLEKYPKLRFPCFDQPYTVSPLSNYLFENTERNRDLLFDKEDVLSVSGEFGVVNQIEFQGRSFAGESVAEYHVVNTNDVVYTKSPLKANPYGIIKTNKGVPGIVSTLYAVYHPKECVDPLYVEYYFGNDLRLNKFLKPLVNIGAKHDMKVNNEFVLTGEVCFPSVIEQQKVVEFLSCLDRRIEKQRTLVEHLKKYKRGVIKEFLNPQTCPIKNAVWSKATIGELGTFVKGAPLSKADSSDEGTPFILYGELYTTYGEVINKVVRKTQRSVDNVYLSRIGDVLIPTSGETPEEISTASCVMVSDVILAGDLNIFRTSKVDGRIMSYVLNHIVNGNIARIAQGKSVVHIQASEISKISISYPDENTQQQLISVFDGVSERITLAEESLAKLILLKKSLNQKMFI